ncbi:WSC domain-containing protein 1-like isoform X2 [Zootermopsis nevadensis]|uniref:WSC domain-containing protein 1-like isoform X2 n=1 Tax=Zootermopsis nevadensis TaxID=136037 RepID=UPI000B8EDCB1|nr:WSC domain-containing protein 1-like isoform X2 [Zootermopsis nevadensis]XP_021940467.1 WSC domain-containing protein 1-like isoform X2 [Zootermopsis nevadensis]
MSGSQVKSFRDSLYGQDSDLSSWLLSWQNKTSTRKVWCGCIQEIEVLVALIIIVPTLRGKCCLGHTQLVPTHNDVNTVNSQLDPHIPGLSVGIEVDRNRKTFIPWPYSEECGRYRIHFARQKSLPMTALVSFPGSGNTWVRYLLETASGIFTGSVYIDRRIISKGFYGEAVPPDCGCTVVQKTHGFALDGLVPAGLAQRTAEMKLFQGRGILLLRNPYEALLSYRNFLYGGHTGFAPHSRFRGPEWERFATQLAVVWKELAATWINYTRGHEAMVLHFEKLHLYPHHDLSRLLDYLGISVDEQRIGCVMNHIDGPFKRPQSSQQILFKTRDPFSEKLHRILDAVIFDLDRMLEKRGWDRIPIHLYKFYKRNST